LIDALTKLKDQKFNAGVAIAESEGVARMLVDAGRAITRVRTALHKREYKSAYQQFRKAFPDVESYPSWRRRHLKDLSHVESIRHAKSYPEGYLYYHYGIKPTINDIDGAVSEVITRGHFNPSVQGAKVVGYAKVRQAGVAHGSDTGFNFDHHWSWLNSMRVILHVYPKNRGLQMASQLGVTNPGEAIWNRIPFSFLVDYFVSVGDWLHILDSWVGWDFSSWEAIERKVGENKIVLANSQEASLGYHVMSPGHVRYKKIKRDVVPSLYGPMADVIPMVKLRNPSMTQVTSMLSLLATSFKRTVRP
jgi:hypothetical protein